jgi:GrpB-like predicted nucleotidyltransferase (UPF0157 family)
MVDQKADPLLDAESSLNQAIREPIAIVPYDSAWPSQFELERNRLRTLFPRLLLLEHIGSTAVPGMPAKPIIDCMAAVASMEVADQLVAQLCLNGYTTSDEFNRSLGDRRWLMRHAAGRRTHHLHLVLDQSVYLADSIRFRDKLRGHSEVARRYAQLKYELASEFGMDREAYTTAKTAFIVAALREA